MLFLGNTSRVTCMPVAFTQVTSESLSAEEREPSLTLTGDNFAFLMHNDIETLFITVEKVMGIEVVGRDSSVSIASRYGLDGPGIESRWPERYSAPVQTGPGAHRASCTMGTGSFLGVKRPGPDVDHPLHLVPRLKKE